MSTQDISLQCFENIIGLSRTDCECYDLNIYDESKSDLYLDEIQGLSLSQLKELDSCETYENVFLNMDRARNNAILTCINDITGKLSLKHRLRRETFVGAIGRKKFLNDRTTSKKYMGVRWYCADIVSGNLKITKISTLFNASGNITLYIYNNENELLHTVPLVTTANTVKVNTLATPIELQAHSQYVDNVEYFFIYEYDAAMKPKDNDIACMTGCDGISYKFNCQQPYYNSVTNKKRGWANYCMVGGFETDTLTDFDDVLCTSDGYMNGLLFDVEFGCKIQEVICKDTLDFDNNLMAITLAFMVQHKAAEILLTNLMFSNKLNRDTMINTESIGGLITFYKTKYDAYLDTIMKQIDVKATDCFECVDFIKMTRRGLLA